MAKIIIEDKEERIFDCTDGDTILRAALRSGIGFPYACNVGSCGNCRFTLLEGSVEHMREDAPAWTERDLKRQRYLGCQARPGGDCRIKLRLDSKYEPRHSPVRTRATLTHKTEITHDLSEFAFELDTPTGFRPGQYALVYVPGVEGGRPYSMCNVSDGGNVWRFLIKRMPGGAATTVLFDELSPGDTVSIDGPYGTAFFREDSDRDIACIAGGSGLSPVISIARAAAISSQFPQRRIDFLYGGRTARDICGENMLAELPGFNETLHFYPAISDTDQDDGTWKGRVGFVHVVAQELFDDELLNREIYFAGPPAMAAAMQKMLFELKVPFDQIHFDEFY